MIALSDNARYVDGEAAVMKVHHIILNARNYNIDGIE